MQNKDINNDTNNFDNKVSNSYLLKDFIKRTNITKEMIKFIDNYNKEENKENENK